MNYLWASLLILLLMTAGTGAEQKADDFIFPSEDELFESYLIGEITYDEYHLLLDIISNRIDLSKINLSDELPLSILYRYLGQLSIDTISDGQRSKPSLRFKHSYSSYIEELPKSKYQTSFEYTGEKLQFDLTLRREHSGRERIIYRSLTLPDVTDNIDEIRIGSFTKKFGLGTVIGYHGKAVSFSNRIDTESFFQPDYGGQNGIFLSSCLGGLRIQTVTSFVRDDNHSLFTEAVSLSKKFQRFEIASISAMTAVKNRKISQKILDYKTSMYTDFKSGAVRFKSEIAVERIDAGTEFAFLSENKIKLQNYLFGFDSWIYSPRFTDLSGGSRTSRISQSNALTEVDYHYSTKRMDQKGFEANVQSGISSSTQANVTYLYAYKSSDSTEMQLFSQVGQNMNDDWIFLYDFSYRDKQRYSIGEGSYIKRIHRLTAKFQSSKLNFRTYLAYELKTGEDDFISLFFECKRTFQNYGLLQLWLNIGEYNLKTDRVEYIYFFIRNKFDLTKWGKLDIKLSHRYGRERVDENRNQISMIFECAI